MINNTTARRVPVIMPFQEGVTYFDRTGNDNFASQAVTRAHRKKITKTEPGFDPQLLLAADLIWQITTQYISVQPSVNDYLVDGAGVSRVVMQVTEQFHGQVFNLLCRKGA
jgi:hypothetical protein